jgi:hypothetical protein
MSERKITQIKRAFFLSLLIISLSAAGAAQTVTGTIKGIVVDTADAIVPGASIEIVNVETGLKRNLETGDDGTYQATFLPLGRYTVSASNSVFVTLIR